jgi:multicomponent Na+:H+ antiporter subunit E
VSPEAIAPPGLRQVPLIAWLVLLWILLWGTWSWANLLSGLVVAGLVTWLLPLPPVVEHARLRPLAALHLVAWFVRDLLVSSVQLARLSLRRGPARAAVIGVQLRTDSDLLLTLITETVNLVPGALVLDVDRTSRRLLVHVLLVRDGDEVEQQRRNVLIVEERVVRAFGSAREVAALDGPADPRPPTPGGRP